MKSLYEYLQQSFITEMADSLSQFKDRIESQLGQIMENYCLVWYCDNYDKDNVNRNHWASEFLAVSKKITNTIIKVRNRKKIIENVLICSYELDNTLNVINWIEDKIKKEHLEKYIGDMANAFSNNIKDIIDALSGNYNDVKDYIQYPIGY